MGNITLKWTNEARTTHEKIIAQITAQTLINECTNVWANKWMNKWMNEWLNKRKNEWMGAIILKVMKDECTDEWKAQNTGKWRLKFCYLIAHCLDKPKGSRLVRSSIKIALNYVEYPMEYVSWSFFHYWDPCGAAPSYLTHACCGSCSHVKTWRPSEELHLMLQNS